MSKASEVITIKVEGKGLGRGIVLSKIKATLNIADFNFRLTNKPYVIEVDSKRVLIYFNK